MDSLLMDGPSDSPNRPLTKKKRVRAALLGPYWFLVVVRMLALAFFLNWRFKHPNHDAFWLYTMSVICETWFAFTWLLDQLPKLFPVNRSADLDVLKERFETPSSFNPTGKSLLPAIDVFVSTADPEKEPPLVTANTILSILAADYPAEKLACFVSDDGGALLTLEAMAQAAYFARLWVPFCRKHDIEPRNPESYFNLKRDPYNRRAALPGFVAERRVVKREYDEFKVRINGLSNSIRRRSDVCNALEERNLRVLHRENNLKLPKATWMVNDGTGSCTWPGTWIVPAPKHSRGDHEAIIQVVLMPPPDEPVRGTTRDVDLPIDFSEVDIRLPMLVYVSREKRPGYDHNKKAGAMNALLRASAVMSNGPFILNLDCDHYIFNSKSIREGMCFMMDRDGDRISYVQFPQRFEGIDPSDRYANHNTVFFDINMRGLDGLQGPVYVGTGCLFRKIALYGFDPPTICKKTAVFPEEKGSTLTENGEETFNYDVLSKKFGHSSLLVDTLSSTSRPDLNTTTITEAVKVTSSWFEDKTEWGDRVGWIYGSVTEDVVTGYRMHNRGWKSVYCATKHGDAFRGTAPINLTDRLHQVLRWATGSVEIFFSPNNALLATSKMKLLQRVVYLNVGIYPFTSIFLVVYCFLPAFSLFTNQFIAPSPNQYFLCYLLVISIAHSLLAWLEITWSGIKLEDWWRNEQFWLIGGTSAHLVAVLQGILKVVAGIEISFTLTSKSANDDEGDEFADLYVTKWTSLMILPTTIIMINLIAIGVGVRRVIFSVKPQWGQLVGGVFFSFWVLVHLYPFAKGLMGRHRRTPTIVIVWSGLFAIVFCLLWTVIERSIKEGTFHLRFA